MVLVTRWTPLLMWIAIELIEHSAFEELSFVWTVFDLEIEFICESRYKRSKIKINVRILVII